MKFQLIIICLINQSSNFKILKFNEILYTLINKIKYNIDF